jgi:mannitol-1-phosphate 5-dehydrogenase
MPDQRCFVGLGFGPIQAGLFLYEASRTGRFARLVVAEVDQRIVDFVRASGGEYHLNIAHAGGIEKAVVRGVEAYNPRRPGDRQNLLAAIAEADELSTALPNVSLYASGGDESVVSVLADALRNGRIKHRILYAAENHNHAADILASHLTQRLGGKAVDGLHLVNTVIGKMSGVITDPEQIRLLRLATLTPGADRAVLVEAFNRILIGRIPPGAVRGIDVFIEKDDLLPFEEAKLYGHNAIHALIGYLAHQRGLALMSQVASCPDIVDVARRAFLEESGAALVQKYARLNDPLFTADGYRVYAEDLLQRMVNPHLQDLVARVIRDPQRKLSWNDRLAGTMRLALQFGIRPAHMAQGVAAAVAFLLGGMPGSKSKVGETLRAAWAESAQEPMASELVDLTWEAAQHLS